MITTAGIAAIAVIVERLTRNDPVTYPKDS
jgi:hypothetical protein